MPVASCRRSTDTKRRSAASTWKSRSGVGTAGGAHELVGVERVELALGGVAVRGPRRPVSSERSAFCSDSGNVRPIAITSPTDCICVPSTGDAPGSFSNAQRGTLVTT